MIISPTQHQIILGSLLGNGYIVKPKKGINSFLGITIGKDKLWFNYKAYELIDLGNYVDGTRWRSECLPEINEFYNLCYKDNVKTINMEWLDLLKDTGLGIWFGDRYKILNKKVCLNTYAFGVDGNKIIEQYFNEVGIPCEFKKIRETGRIVFTKQGTEIFLETILHRLPDFFVERLEFLR